MSRTIQSIRTTRLTVLICAAAATVAAMVFGPVSAALAYGPAPTPRSRGHFAISPTIIHTTSSTGLAVWLVLLIALAAVGFGAGLTELIRLVGRRHHTSGPLAA